MEKISANVDEKEVVDLDYSIKKNIYNLSDYFNLYYWLVIDNLSHYKIRTNIFKKQENVAKSQ